MNSNEEKRSWGESCHQIYNQCRGVCYKNLRNHLSQKKKLIGELILPLTICIIFISMKKIKNHILAAVLGMLLKMYIGLIASSSIRQVITLFVFERTQHFRQYQMIQGLSHRCHTLSNLLYMGMYMSIFIFPFYLTLNLFQFSLVYIFNFAAFVISSATLAMALSSLFKDHKVALEIVGLLFSLGAFLPFFYTAGNGLLESYSYTLVDYIAMIMPNSAFTIAILQKNIMASVYSLSCVKIYFLIYSLIQFPQFYKDCLCNCFKKIGQYIPILHEKRQNQLMEQFEMNQVVGPDLEENMKKQNKHEKSSKNLAIKLENVVKTYTINKQKINAVNNINLEIKRSQIFGLLGRNGAGKTTLVDILTKVIKPTSGYYTIVSSQNTRSSIGICYQHQILYENLTVQEHLVFYSFIKDIGNTRESNQHENIQRKEKIQEIIQTLNINEERNKKVKELSGGNKRKLSIAIAILGKPDILIFDEPTSGLDPLSRIYVWQIFEKLRNIYECTIILTTHHLDEAEKLSDSICVIEKGNIIVESTAQEIKQKYGKGYYLTITDLQFEHTLSKKENQNQFADFLKRKSQQIESYKAIFQKSKLKYEQLQQVNSYIKFFIKPYTIKKQKVTNQQFEEEILHIIEALQKEFNETQDRIKIRIQNNTLEESFIALIKDPENKNSGDSITQYRSFNARPSENSNSSLCVRYLRQVYGVILKNFYYCKSTLIQSLVMYNINILIIGISIFFNTFLIKAIASEQNMDEEDLTQSKKLPSNNQSNNNKLLLLQGYVIMATAFIGLIVYEKEKKIKQVLNTRGLRGVSYWCGHFIFDYLLFVVNLLMAKYLVAHDLYEQFETIEVLLLGVCMLLYTYTFSSLFNKVKTANTWFSLINMLFGFILQPILLFGQNNQYLQYLSFLKYIYPYYDLSVVAFFQNNQINIALIGGVVDRNKVIYINILVYFTLLVALQCSAWQRITTFIKNKNSLQQPQQVISTDTIQLENVSKAYGDIQALKNVSYQVNSQRLALLGHNGAGKSTTFSILSSQISPDAGKVFLQSKLKFSYQKVLESTGICYQEDTLWENMSVKEIMKIFSFVVSVQNSQKEIQWLFESLQFDLLNLHKRFLNLSGGNKRKVCMAIALYGSPTIRLLDECSTGLDPSSRLAMVDTIKFQKDGCTVFTTHSMSEAQNLCLKTVIMSKGQVLEFDYIEKLKHKYFNCSWVELYLKSFTNEEVQALKQLDQIKEQLLIDSFKIIQQQKNILKVEVDNKIYKLSSLMHYFQKLKRKHSNFIEYFNNIEPKLEDVYIKVTKDDREEEELRTNTMRNILSGESNRENQLQAI